MADHEQHEAGAEGSDQAVHDDFKLRFVVAIPVHGLSPSINEQMHQQDQQRSAHLHADDLGVEGPLRALLVQLEDLNDLIVCQLVVLGKLLFELLDELESLFVSLHQFVHDWVILLGLGSRC